VLKVLVVDDSAVVRGLISKALEEDSRITVAGTAGNGQRALEIAQTLKPDIIILDIEMPVMDGLTALPLLLKIVPKCKIIMCSSFTQSSVAITIKALEMGAADTIGKPLATNGESTNGFRGDLRRKVLALGGLQDGVAGSSQKVQPAVDSVSADMLNAPLNLKGVEALAIASSTGGPQALMTLFADLKGALRDIPIFITQHMPPSFTAILAEHLAKVGHRVCKEAVDGEVVRPGCTYIAPGDYHMLLEKASVNVFVRLTQDPPENYCRPAADPMLRSLSTVYGSHLAVLVLTGMGQDGLLGCKQVVEQGGAVVAQDQSTSVVYGMPKAVAANNLCKAILPLPKIARYLIEQIEGKAV